MTKNIVRDIIAKILEINSNIKLRDLPYYLFVIDKFHMMKYHRLTSNHNSELEYSIHDDILYHSLCKEAYESYDKESDIFFDYLSKTDIDIIEYVMEIFLDRDIIEYVKSLVEYELLLQSDLHIKDFIYVDTNKNHKFISFISKKEITDSLDLFENS
jgi:hypothetical protein